MPIDVQRGEGLLRGDLALEEPTRAAAKGPQLDQVEGTELGRIPGVLVSTDVGLHVALRQERQNRCSLLEPLPRSIPSLADPE